METITIPKDKFEIVISDVERLVSHFEELAGDEDNIVKQRLNDVKEGRVEGRSEKDLNEYLKKRGVKVA